MDVPLHTRDFSRVVKRHFFYKIHKNIACDFYLRIVLREVFFYAKADSFYKNSAY